MTNRFTDDEIAEWATEPVNGIWETGKDWNTYCLAREVQEWRAKAAADTVADALDAAEVKLAAIDALHQPCYDMDPDSFTIGYRFCTCGCEDPWPACPTHLILHPEDDA